MRPLRCPRLRLPLHDSVPDRAASLSLPPQLEAPSSQFHFRRVYDEHFAFTWRTLRYLGVPKSQLDDAGQEVWVIVHKKLSEFEGRSQLSTWLFRIASNVARNIQRVERRRGTLDPLPVELPSVSPGPVEQQQGRELWASLQSFMGTLDEQKRTIFVASLLEGMSANECAQLTSLSTVTVNHRIRALRRSFRTWMQRHLEEHDAARI